MNLITVEGLTHSYTDRMLFKEASFSLNEHEKVGSSVSTEPVNLLC